MWFKFNTIDFLAATDDLTATGAGIYMRVLTLYMSGNMKPIQLQRWQILQFCRAAPKDAKHLDQILETKFYRTASGWIPRLSAQFLSEVTPPEMDTRMGPPTPPDLDLQSVSPSMHAAAFIGAPDISKKELKKRVGEKKAAALRAEMMELLAPGQAELRLENGLVKAEVREVVTPQTPGIVARREYNRRHRANLKTLRETAADMGLHTDKAMRVRELVALIQHAQRARLSGDYTSKPQESDIAALPLPGELHDAIWPITQMKNQRENEPVDIDSFRGDEIFSSLDTEGVRKVQKEEGGRGAEVVLASSCFSVSKIMASNVGITSNAGIMPGGLEKNIPGATAVGLAARALRRSGISDAHPGHQRLATALEQGVTLDDLTEAAERATERQAPRIAYVLAIAENLAKERAAREAPPLGTTLMPSGESALDLDKRIFGEDD